MPIYLQAPEELKNSVEELVEELVKYMLSKEKTTVSLFEAFSSGSLKILSKCFNDIMFNISIL